ncbi:MAG TPA: hypothetical protein VFX49_22230, partial [Chloroflexota bacterium]|nr:hypothetical protein [Chloroflexota bacterium]
MKTPTQRTEEITRRLVLGGAAALPGSLAACALPTAGAAPSAQEAPPDEGDTPDETGMEDAATPVAPVEEVLAATPACADDDDETPAQTEGPYFTRDSPERTSLLEPGTRGTRLVVAGRVVTTDCKPVGRALLDFWQADDAGAYDNRGSTLRGHLFTDE